MHESTRLQIETEIDTRIATGLSISVKYENADFDRGGLSEWIESTIINGETFNASFGSSKKVRTVAVLNLAVFVARGSGTKRLREIADGVAAAFRNLRLSSGGVKIEFLQASMDNGDPGDPAFFRENITLPFRAEEIQSDAT